MHRKLYTHFIALASTAFFILGGLGFNIVNYCCSSCESSGIEMVAEKTCNALHHNEGAACCHKHEDDIACNNVGHQPQGCHILRVKVDTPVVDSLIELKVSSITVFHSLFVSKKHLISDIDPLFYSFSLPPPNINLHFSGREILSLHATLLI